MKLSILLPTIPERAEMFEKLLQKVLAQKTDEVEVIVDDSDRWDITGIKVGDKRQRLMEKAKGDYITWVDDDDDVSDDYVYEILKAIETNVDVICYNVLSIINGVEYVIDVSLTNPIEQLHNNGAVKRTPSVTSCYKRDVALRGKFPSLNNGEDFEWIRQIDLKTEHKIDKVLHIYNYSDAKTVASKEVKRCVVSFANGDYLPLIERQRNSVKVFSKCKYETFNNYGDVECKPHTEYPYAFKPYSIHKAHRNGSNLILWMDSPVYPVKDLDPLFKLIQDNGVLIVENVGYSIASHTNDNCLSMFGLTRDEASKHPMAMACVMGFDMQNPRAYQVFCEYLNYAHTEAYKGSWVDHRHDQSVLSILAMIYGIKMQHPDGIIAYARLDEHKDWKDNAIVLSDRSL